MIFPSGDTHGEKHESAARQIRDFLTLEAIDESQEAGHVIHVVEDCLGGFTGGLTTKQTLMKLAAMNAVVSFVLSGFGRVIHLPPVTTKRITGLKVPKGGNKKLEVIKLARSREPSFPYAETAAGNWVKGTDDMADAWLLTEAGIAITRGEASIGQPKKAKGDRGKTRSRKGDSAKKGRVRVPVSGKSGASVLKPGPGQGAALDQS